MSTSRWDWYIAHHRRATGQTALSVPTRRQNRGVDREAADPLRIAIERRRLTPLSPLVHRVAYQRTIRSSAWWASRRTPYASSHSRSDVEAGICAGTGSNFAQVDGAPHRSGDRPEKYCRSQVL